MFQCSTQGCRAAAVAVIFGWSPVCQPCLDASLDGHARFNAAGALTGAPPRPPITVQEIPADLTADLTAAARESMRANLEAATERWCGIFRGIDD